MGGLLIPAFYIYTLRTYTFFSAVSTSFDIYPHAQRPIRVD
jgi:hypothetical protein